MKPITLQLENNYKQYQNYYDLMLGESNYYETGGKVVINSPSPYVRYHELAHSIQDKKHYPFYICCHVLRITSKFFPQLKKYWQWLNFFVERQACLMAIQMTRFVNRWDLDQATIARSALLTYAQDDFQRMLVDRIDFSFEAKFGS